jgi:1-acyl-sn-glycerol-3-phosphate acyltransferase
MSGWQYYSAHDLGLQGDQRYCSPLRENDFTQNLLRLGWLASIRLVFKLWNHLEIRGLENVPVKPPFVITANHTSHLDALVLASALSLRWRDQISPLAAGDYFFCSKLRAAFSATVLNALPLWRQRQQGRRHELSGLRDRLLQQSAIYIVFPEGSRSRDGALHDFKPGFATLVAGTATPVLACHLSGSFDALPPDKGFVRPRKIVLQIGTPVTFETVANHVAGWRQICAAIRQQTVALQSCGPPIAKSRHDGRRGKLLLLFRFARVLLHRRLRRMVVIPSFDRHIH